MKKNIFLFSLFLFPTVIGNLLHADDPVPPAQQPPARKKTFTQANPSPALKSVQVPTGGPGSTDEKYTRRHKAKGFMESLSPEDLEQLQKTWEEKPETIKDEIKKKIIEKKNEEAEENAKISGLVKQYRQAKDESSKAQIESEIKKSLRALFDRRMENNRKRLELSEKRLGELKRKYEERLSRADEIIDERFREISKDPELIW